MQGEGQRLARVNKPSTRLAGRRNRYARSADDFMSRFPRLRPAPVGVGLRSGQVPPRPTKRSERKQQIPRCESLRDDSAEKRAGEMPALQRRRRNVKGSPPFVRGGQTVGHPPDQIPGRPNSKSGPPHRSESKPHRLGSAALTTGKSVLPRRVGGAKKDRPLRPAPFGAGLWGAQAHSPIGRLAFPGSGRRCADERATDWRRPDLTGCGNMQNDFPQGLKPNASKAIMSELKLRPPKKHHFFRSLLMSRGKLRRPH
jgi:hypothetical protein